MVFDRKISLFVVTLNSGMLKSLVHLPVRHGDMENLSVQTAQTSGVALLVSFLTKIQRFWSFLTVFRIFSAVFSIVRLI